MAFESPCDADLDAMPSFDGGRQRFCSQCMKSVHMLSEMTRDEARDFVRDNRDACMSYRRGDDGRLVFRSAPPPVIAAGALTRRVRTRPRALAAAPVLAALAGCSVPVVEAEVIQDEGIGYVESQAYASYAAVPEAVPCEAPEPEPEPEPKREPNNEVLINGQIGAIGQPGHYAGGISAQRLDPLDPFGGGIVGIGGGGSLSALEHRRRRRGQLPTGDATRRRAAARLPRARGDRRQRG